MPPVPFPQLFPPDTPMPRIPASISQRAHQFAGWVTFIWIFFSIGALYAARLASVMGEPTGILPYLLGGTFAVWFITFFGYLVLMVPPVTSESRQEPTSEGMF